MDLCSRYILTDMTGVLEACAATMETGLVLMEETFRFVWDEPQMAEFITAQASNRPMDFKVLHSLVNHRNSD